MPIDPEANDALAGAARMREVVERLRALLLAATWTDWAGTGDPARSSTEVEGGSLS